MEWVLILFESYFNPIFDLNLKLEFNSSQQNWLKHVCIIWKRSKLIEFNWKEINLYQKSQNILTFLINFDIFSLLNHFRSFNQHFQSSNQNLVEFNQKLINFNQKDIYTVQYDMISTSDFESDWFRCPNLLESDLIWNP